jgi:hypothetical protein
MAIFSNLKELKYQKPVRFLDNCCKKNNPWILSSLNPNFEWCKQSNEFTVKAYYPKNMSQGAQKQECFELF